MSSEAQFPNEFVPGEVLQLGLIFFSL